MGKTFTNFSPLKTAYMRRKIETGKRCISAFPHPLENGRYLPPISKAICLRVQRLNKKLTAYAELFQYAYAYMRGEHRIGDASPFPFRILLIDASTGRRKRSLEKWTRFKR